ncbi:hypothetical protein AB5J72_28525 [Streptomyces sp. CG1]|uniref:hypothetical protein n=1 Tax=Streptomyces sp. CG1 TaxID=1287523 RepID=UPI0034E26B11
MVANVAAPSGSPFGEPRGLGKPQEPENEVDDFPVMWAATGTARRQSANQPHKPAPAIGTRGRLTAS